MHRDSSTIISKNHFVAIAKVSPQTILLKNTIGESIDPNDVTKYQTINSIEVGFCTIESANNAVANDFDNIGLISLDGIFCPYVIKPGGGSHANLPYWELPTSSSDINSINLNPFNTNNLFFESGVFNADRFYESGHNINLINSTSGVGRDSKSNLSVYKELAYNNKVSYENGIRAVGLRAPLILSGPGYKTNGKPIPADPNDENKFANDAFRNPSKWPSGPVDLRFDDERKVWTASGIGREGVRHIKFTIVSAVDGSLSVFGSYDEWDVGYTESDVPGDLNTLAGISPPLGVVEIFDSNGCYFDEPADELLGRSGYAHYLLPRGSYSEPRWVVTSLCCRKLTCSEGN
jgi:hypothetical protein